MKNYSLTPQESKNFILGYKLNKNKIIIKFASRRKCITKYDKDIETTILNIMKQQVIYSDDFLNIEKRNLRINIFANILLTLFTLVSAILGISVFSAVILVPLIFIVFNSISIIDDKLTINDVEKNKLFIEQELLINQKIDKSNLKNTKLSKKNIVDSNFDITLNSITKLKYKELKKIVNSINNKNNIYSESDNKSLILK